MSDWFVKNVQPDWEIFDVGANVGVYSVLFSRLAHLGHVVAFEPTVTADMLRANLAHNGCKNVQVLQIAIGSKTGSVEDGIYRIWGKEQERQVYPFYRLDDYVRNNNITKLDCIKIDVDSFDFEVLLGARETLRTLKPMVVVELNHALSHRNQSNVKALEWLYEQGIGEVLALDGDNFVITPGRRPSATYAVQGAISIAFADTREMPWAEDEGAIKILKSIDPRHAAVVHGDSRITVLPGGSQIEVLTGEPQWAYSVAFAMPAEFEPDPDLRILIELEVLKGRVGVGCLSKDGQYIGPERQIGPGGRRALLLPVSDPTKLAEIMLRNASADTGRSTARVYGVKVGRLIDHAAAETVIADAPPGWSAPFEVLRQKWTTIPSGNDLRADSASKRDQSGAEVLEAWGRAHANDTEGEGFGIRGWYHELYRSFMAGKKVLDIGCGMGISTIAFAEMGADLTFVDIVEDNVRLVQRLCALKGINAKFFYMENIESLAALDRGLRCGDGHRFPDKCAFGSDEGRSRCHQDAFEARRSLAALRLPAIALATRGRRRFRQMGRDHRRSRRALDGVPRPGKDRMAVLTFKNPHPLRMRVPQ
jgi:FkbM family methyltransferase